MRYRIFISFTNYQNYCINEILKQDNKTCDLLITNSKHINQSIAYLSINKIDSIAKLLNNLFFKENKKHIEKFLQDKIKNESIEEIEIVIPHYNNILANYVMKFIEDKYKYSNPQIKIIKSIYPDGLAMFYPTNLEYKQFLLKYIASYFVGMPIRYINSNDMLNPFKEIDFYYSYIPKITYNPYNLPIKKIAAKKETIKGNNCLILGYGKNDFHDIFIEDFIFEIENNKRKLQN